ncbi:MAG TPA: 4'-phosphopantetheinyl transferase superfamily protein [Thermoanaerobaculia bacterium]|nr:4'-phosphopantetheinyl transferase superfamily protein [Thermoanaerobaculia bacterium]
MSAFPPSRGPEPLGRPPEPGEIHVWTARLDPPEQEVAAARRLLDADELIRADRFRFEVHRRRFTVGRAFQRTILGAYLGRPPASLVYLYGPKGKPSLAPGHGDGILDFNLSNTEEMALLGVTAGRELGVDIEQVRALSDLEALAERFFSAAESRVLLALPDADRPIGFFNCWTRKEAYLKAIGDGLSAPLDAFDVTLVPGEPARMIALEGSPERAAAWQLFHLEPATGYLGAVAIEGAPPAGEWRLILHHWQPT